MDNEIDEKEFLPAEVVNQYLGDYNATTTLIDTIFIPSKRVPKDLLDQMAEDKDKLNEQLLANLPLLQTVISQPYWTEGKNKRPFDSLSIQVFASVCLADDRHCLESIIACSAMYRDLSTKTLRQAIKWSKINFELNHLNSQHHSQLDMNIFTSIYDYYLVDISTLCSTLGIANAKPNKLTIMQRLRRLGLMEVLIEPMNKGQAVDKARRRFNLVDSRAIIPLLCLDSVKSKSQVTDDTFTHLIVGVDRGFSKSLEKEGAISRNRFLEVYPGLKANGVTDFMKYLDSHHYSYLNGKFLKTIVEDYLNRKVRVTQKHQTVLVNNLIAEVLNHRDLLLEKFELELYERELNGVRQWKILSLKSQKNNASLV